MLRTRLAVLLIGALCACGSPAGSAASMSRGNVPPSVGPSLAATRPQLPDDFPVLPGAAELPVPAGNPGVIARWSTHQIGSAAYDFYSDALLAAGYRVEGRYPGGTGAVIRFIGPANALWQVVIQGVGADSASIEVRVDRP